jgi:hypothetical protein
MMPVAALAAGTPWTCNLVVAPPQDATGKTVTYPPPRDSGSQVKQAEATAPREKLGTAPTGNPPGLPVKLSEEAVVRALDVGQPQFIRCFKKAHDADPTWDSLKVKVQLELDAQGVVVGVKSDAIDPKLAACLARIARNLSFPSPGKAATVELPLFFRS